MFIPFLNYFPNRFFRILRFPALIFATMLFVLMFDTAAFSRSVTLSLNPNTRSYPAGYRVYYDTYGRSQNYGDYEFNKIVKINECELMENNIVTFDLELELEPGQDYYFSVTAFNDGKESCFSDEWHLSVSPDSDGDGILDDAEKNIYKTDPYNPDSDDDGIWDGRELELGKNPLLSDATVDYSVQVTMDQELQSIPNPVGYEVFYDIDSRWEWQSDFDDYEFSREVGIEECRLDGEFVTCDLNIEFKPGGTYFLSAKTFDNKYESAFSNEISFTLPADVDFDGIPDGGEIAYGTDTHNPDSDNDGIRDGDELKIWGECWSDDYDGDGLINILDPDSDNDGILDGRELELGKDPLQHDSLAEYSRSR
ncbi:MAG: hypothetical protein U9O82_06305 [Thermodesulfobacteriota bacterium]|nr:hypothetical protein [Thermodesulfobacteriota bacterium]